MQAKEKAWASKTAAAAALADQRSDEMHEQVRVKVEAERKREAIERRLEENEDKQEAEKVYKRSLNCPIQHTWGLQCNIQFSALPRRRAMILCVNDLILSHPTHNEPACVPSRRPTREGEGKGGGGGHEAYARNEGDRVHIETNSS